MSAGEKRKADALIEESVNKKPHILAIQKQTALLTRKNEVESMAKPGLPVPYVTATGGQFLSVLDPKEKTPRPPAPPLNRSWGISVLRGPGCSSSLREGAFLPAKTIEDADCVAVDETAARWCCPEALAARLHGKRLVDASWIASRTHSGVCFPFRSWMHVATTTLWLSDEFRKHHKDHACVLDLAARCSPKRSNGEHEVM